MHFKLFKFRSRFLRAQDRKRNEYRYPKLNYPEIYLLEGGYKAFYENYKVTFFKIIFFQRILYRNQVYKEFLQQILTNFSTILNNFVVFKQCCGF